MPILKSKSGTAHMTLDDKHNEFLQKFREEDNVVIPQINAHVAQLKAQLKTKMHIDDHLRAKDELHSLRQTLSKLEKARRLYFVKNTKHIFDYFEEKKNISSGNTDNVKVLHTFFKAKNSEPAKNTLTHANSYFINVDQKFIDGNKYVDPISVCRKCNKGEFIPMDFEGVLICNNAECSAQIPYLVENEKPSYKEPPKEVCFYAYKRINHFREILAQFQAKESTQIPEEILSNVLAQIKKERIDVKTITNKKTKEILKKFGYNKYYEHIPFIKDKLGIKPPIMTQVLEDKLCSLFMEIQRPYAKFCPTDRVNFLNYYYTIYKLCELLDETAFLKYFPMLKDRQKMIEQDQIWALICEELRWEFVATV